MHARARGRHAPLHQRRARATRASGAWSRAGVRHALGACKAQRNACNAVWATDRQVHVLAAEQNRRGARPWAASSGVGAAVHAIAWPRGVNESIFHEILIFT
eukprot:COSAG02_NODE_801_length_17030_cov_150.308428_15_plen_102_part_00